MANMKNIIIIGKRTRDWYMEKGMVRTVFGWLHKDWISDLFSKGWISGVDPMTYAVRIPYREYESYEGQGRNKKRVTKGEYDGEFIKKFWQYLDNKKSAFYEVNKEEVKTIADYFRKHASNLEQTKKELL